MQTPSQSVKFHMIFKNILFWEGVWLSNPIPAIQYKRKTWHGSIFQPQEVIKVKVIQLCKAMLNTKHFNFNPNEVKSSFFDYWSVIQCSTFQLLNIQYRRQRNPCNTTTDTWHLYALKHASRMHFYRSSLCCLSLTDHMFAVCRGASSAFLRTVQSGLHLLHLLLQHLLLLSQLLGTVREDKQRWKSINHCCNKSVPCICTQMHLTPWPDCFNLSTLQRQMANI